MTFNKYVTEGVQDGTIPTIFLDGCTCYLVRKPLDGEEVTGYTNFSSLTVEKSPTELAKVQ